MKRYGKEAQRQRVSGILHYCQHTDEIREAVEEYGYDSEKFKEGNAMLENLKRLVLNQCREYGLYHEAVRNMNNVWDSANQTYKAYVQVARLILKTGKKLTIPRQCNGKMKKKFEDWLHDAYQFYDIVLKSPDWIDGFKNFNISWEDLVKGKQMINAVVLARKRKNESSYSATESTARRDEAFNKLEVWCSALVAIAKIALGKNSSHVKKLSRY